MLIAVAEVASPQEQSFSVADVLGRCLSPPSTVAVFSALSLLRSIGALNGCEGLTPLGAHLRRMPLDPRVAKMLVFGAILGCLDPALTVAAALGHGRPVLLSAPPAAQAEIAAARATLLAPAVAARSDHVALVAAYDGWQRAMNKGDLNNPRQMGIGTAFVHNRFSCISYGRHFRLISQHNLRLTLASHCHT